MGTRSIFFWAVAAFLGLGLLNSHAATPLGNEPSCASLKDDEFTIGSFCKTSKNKCFQVVHDDAFGIGIQEMGDDCKHAGTIWARQLQQTDVNYETAQVACPKGTRPPTQEEFTRLRSSVGTEEYKSDIDWDVKYNKELLSQSGKEELHALLPDMKGNWFWSLSPVDKFFISVFFGNSGFIVKFHHSNDLGSIRCVR